MKVSVLLLTSMAACSLADQPKGWYFCYLFNDDGSGVCRGEGTEEGNNFNCHPDFPCRPDPHLDGLAGNGCTPHRWDFDPDPNIRNTHAGYAQC